MDSQPGNYRWPIIQSMYWDFCVENVHVWIYMHIYHSQGLGSASQQTPDSIVILGM